VHPRDQFRGLRTDRSKLPPNCESSAAAFIRLRQMPQLAHLPSSALRQATRGGESRVFFSLDGSVTWQRVREAHSLEFFRSLSGWAVYCSLRDSRYPATRMLCCGCGRPRWQIDSACRPRVTSGEYFIECDACFLREQTARKQIRKNLAELKALVKTEKAKRRDTQ